MTNPISMLSFIQRILNSDSPRKRKRSSAFSTEHATSSEIEDLRQTIADIEPLANDDEREKAIEEFLGMGEDTSPEGKRRKKEGRLSTITERSEREGGDEKKEKTRGSDHEMVDVELHLEAIQQSRSCNERTVVDQDLWTWKGGDMLQ